jgi:hypothetical protein
MSCSHDWGVSSACVTSWKEALARRPTACALTDSSSIPPREHIFGQTGFDGGLGDIFELQDQVTESVVGAIAPAKGLGGRNSGEQMAAVPINCRRPGHHYSQYAGPRRARSARGE